MTAPNLGSSSASPDRPRVLVDTNLLLRAARTGFPLLAELARLSESAIPTLATPVRRELLRLSEDGSREAAIALNRTGAWPRVLGPGTGDDAILAVALRHRMLLATADRELAERASRAGLDVLVPRDRSRLTLRSGRARAPSATVKNRGGHRDGRADHARRRPPAEPPRRRVR
ncbi:MAG: PIN domain-containing protein [Thermoplasmata archaeon]